MQAIFYDRARDVADAVRLGQQAGARYIAGGTNLLDLMKGDVEHPTRLVDVSRLGLDAIQELPDGGLRIGATARNSDTANHKLVRERYPLLSQALLSGASGQLRNMATTGGNLLQRTRCPYFTDTAFSQCNKREPGSGCGARDGYHRMHAILGASPACIAVNPSDMNVALAALDAVVLTTGPDGERRIPITEFHRLPGDTPERDNSLEHGELIVAIDLPRSNFAKGSYYLKVRDRASYAFALVAVAAALELEGGRVRQARVVLGGVAHKPWRSREAEAALAERPASEETFRRAADAALKDAKPLAHNAYKVELGKRAIVRALMRASRLA